MRLHWVKVQNNPDRSSTHANLDIIVFLSRFPELCGYLSRLSKFCSERYEVGATDRLITILSQSWIKQRTAYHLCKLNIGVEREGGSICRTASNIRSQIESIAVYAASNIKKRRVNRNIKRWDRRTLSCRNGSSKRVCEGSISRKIQSFASSWDYAMSILRV